MLTRFSKPPIDAPERERLIGVLNSGWLVRGKVTEEFEHNLERETGAKRIICTNSCTAALYLALRASGVGPGCEVITSPLTFSATANAIHMTRAKVVFADVDPETLCLDPAMALQEANVLTRAIVPVHLFGNIAKRPPILDGVRVVEDAAQALGATKQWGQSPACFSFHASKNITTGEGGAVATNDEELARKMTIWSQQGIQRDGVTDPQVDWGFKFAMSDVQAALGIPQLMRLGELVRARRHRIRLYDELLEGSEAESIKHGPNSACNLYTVLVPPGKRDKALQEMQRRGHEVRVRYRPLHLEPFWRSPRWNLPVAERQGARILTLPLYADLPKESIHAVAKDLKEVLRGI